MHQADISGCLLQLMYHHHHIFIPSICFDYFLGFTLLLFHSSLFRACSIPPQFNISLPCYDFFIRCLYQPHILLDPLYLQDFNSLYELFSMNMANLSKIHSLIFSIGATHRFPLMYLFPDSLFSCYSIIDPSIHISATFTLARCFFIV